MDKRPGMLRFMGSQSDMTEWLNGTEYYNSCCCTTVFGAVLCCAESLQSCLTLCDPMDCSLPGSSVHGILQARILKWVIMPSSRGSSWPSDWTHISDVSCIGRWFFTTSTTLEAQWFGTCICCKVSNTISLVNISQHTWLQCNYEKFWDLISQHLSEIQYSIINYSHQRVILDAEDVEQLAKIDF